MQTPFESKSLVATLGLLNLNSADTQYARILIDDRWNFSGDFTISILYRMASTVGNYQVFLRNNNSTNWLQFFIQPSNSTEISVQASTPSGLVLATNAAAPVGLVGNIVRVTLTRISGQFYLYLNDRINSSGTMSGAWNLYDAPGDYIDVGGNPTYPIEGQVGQLLVLNGKGMTPTELSEWHYTNVPPKSVHAFVIAHYKTNDSHGSKLIDSVSEYNYAKSSDFFSNVHGDLINYTTDEVGEGSDPNDQTAWVDFYDQTPKTPVFKKALRLIRANSHYLKVTDFIPTKEKGFTEIIGFMLPSDRNFLTGGETLSSKVGSAYTAFRGIIGAAGTRAVVTQDKRHGFGQELPLEMSFHKLNALCFFVSTDSASTQNKTPYPNGHKGTSISNNVPGFSEVIGGFDYRIGSLDSPGNNSLDGYIFMHGVWKGVLSRFEILNIISGQVPGESVGDCQLLLDFSAIIDDAGTYKINDLSPQNNTITLVNYNANEINPVHADYRLHDLIDII